jgi:hypothetical protein
MLVPLDTQKFGQNLVIALEFIGDGKCLNEFQRRRRQNDSTENCPVSYIAIKSVLKSQRITVNLKSVTPHSSSFQKSRIERNGTYENKEVH